MSSSASVAQHVSSVSSSFRNKSLRWLIQSQVASQYTPRTASRSAFICSATSARIRQAQCPLCQGHTQVPCDACGGRGRLTKGGYHANNPVSVARIVGAACSLHNLCIYAHPAQSGCGNVDHVVTRRVDVGSKWTALHRTLGWRHFTATHKMKGGRHTYALLVATCDTTASLWVCCVSCNKLCCAFSTL